VDVAHPHLSEADETAMTMQAGYGKVIVHNLLNGLGSPLTALRLVWRRLFPFGIVSRWAC
jgi:hypothetical protein